MKKARSKNLYVSPGNYVIGRSEPMILQAVLGSCVAVSAYDAEAGIGGLLHLLLPEPPAAEPPLTPEKYASTGLPIFIQALRDGGACMEGLKATVAGGSLLCPLNEADLALDIGGRTAESVLHQLQDLGITIEKSETGGFLKYRLGLNMQGWESSIHLSGTHKISKDHRIEIPNLREIGRTVEHLLPIPQVALKILRTLHEDNYDKYEIGREFGQDQVLSARTMQLCNSIMYQRRYRVESLDEALLILGQEMILKLVMSVAIQKYIDQCSMGYSLCKGGLFQHAVGCAVIAEKLAHLTGQAKPAVAFTAGLLHDIGKVVLDQHVAQAHPLIYHSLQVDKQSLLQAEKRVFGIDHTETGRYLAEEWLISDALTDAIAHHHTPEKAEIAPQLTHIVYLADLIMSKFHPGLIMAQEHPADLSARLAAIGLSSAQLPGIIDRLPPEVFGTSPELALNGTPHPS